MKRIFLILLTISLFFLLSCVTTQSFKQKETVETSADTKPVSVQEAPAPSDDASESAQESPAPAPQTDVSAEQAPVPVQKASVPEKNTEVSVQISPAPVKSDEEYLRSVNDIEVTKETFAEDKTEIMEIISKLAVIMADGDYDGWVKYIDEDTVKYWSNPQNLRKASKMLPVRGLYMNNLRDYFTYVFVPSRKGREVDEIRYISKNNVKAVEVSENSDIIYYYFKKIDGVWFVHIPPL